jgi:hypothetical protein
MFDRSGVAGPTLLSLWRPQAFSNDGGKTWEVNWIATDVRVNLK